jgi:translation initiation factor 2B subunit (eIF-2B alpha/beta/delta family)
LNANGKTIKQIDGFTVAEYARQKGVTVQTVYRRLTSVKRKGYNDVTDVKDGKIVVTKKGVKILDDVFNSCLTSVKQELNTGGTLHEIFSGELESKNKLLDDQQNTIKEQQKTIRELTAALENTTNALRDAQHTANAAQALHAGTIQQQLTDGGDAEDAAVPANEEKPSLWSRVFGKRT